MLRSLIASRKENKKEMKIGVKIPCAEESTIRKQKTRTTCSFVRRKGKRVKTFKKGSGRELLSDKLGR